MQSLKRKIYKKGNSYFTGVPFQALSNLDKNKKYESEWSFNIQKDCWEIRFKNNL